jgi:hypothetical protein
MKKSDLVEREGSEGAESARVLRTVRGRDEDELKSVLRHTLEATNRTTALFDHRTGDNRGWHTSLTSPLDTLPLSSRYSLRVHSVLGPLMREQSTR